MLQQSALKFIVFCVGDRKVQQFYMYDIIIISYCIIHTKFYDKIS